jgi:protease I
MQKSFSTKKILVMVANGVDEASMSVVQRALMKTGATIKTAGMESGLVNSWNGNGWGLYFPVDQQLGMTLGSDFDCLIVPSGSRGILKLATSAHCERILASFLTAQKPIALMGDAVALLEKTGLGAEAGKPNILTGDDPADAFIARMLEHFAGVEIEKVAA